MGVMVNGRTIWQTATNGAVIPEMALTRLTATQGAATTDLVVGVLCEGLLRVATVRVMVRHRRAAFCAYCGGGTADGAAADGLGCVAVRLAPVSLRVSLSYGIDPQVSKGRSGEKRLVFDVCAGETAIPLSTVASAGDIPCGCLRIGPATIVTTAHKGRVTAERVIVTGRVGHRTVGRGHGRGAAVATTAMAAMVITIRVAGVGRVLPSRAAKGYCTRSCLAQRARRGRGRATAGGKVTCALRVAAFRVFCVTALRGCRATGVVRAKLGGSEVGSEAVMEEAVVGRH